MQISVVSVILLQAVASTLAANLWSPSNTDIYNCTVLSDVYSDWCCVKIQTYPADSSLSPDVQVYNFAGSIISSSNVSYGVERAFYSDLYYTVDVTANYTSLVNNDGWADESNFWFAGERYGAYDTAAAELAVLSKESTNTKKEAALTAAYWFECGSAAAGGESVETTTDSSDASCSATTAAGAAAAAAASWSGQSTNKSQRQGTSATAGARARARSSYTTSR